MNIILEKFSSFVSYIDQLIWGFPMIVFLLGTHLYLTYKTNFIQRFIFKGIKLSLKNNQSHKGNGDLSIFGSLMTALSSTIGTGNIIGVGTAIFFGGPGAVLWTWIGGIFGIATKYAESYIATKYRKKLADGSYLGSAMTAFEHLNKPLLAKTFAVFAAIAAFGIGCATQSSAIVSLLSENYDIKNWLSGLILCILTAIVIFGGIKSISRVCERLVPLMSIVYVIGCFAILVFNYKYLADTIILIIKSAFIPRAALGGFVGSTIISASRYGIARGLFSNEAGMGSAPMASATGKANNAIKPALIGATGVFWDTIVVCLMTGLVIVSSIISNDAISTLNYLDGAALVSACFKQIPYIGMPLLVFGIITFSYSTILGWSYYGEASVIYLFGKKAIKPYQMIWIIVIFIGATLNLSTVWEIADILNALMCIPNVIAIVMLRKELVKDTKYYLLENHLEENDLELE